ncbi:winged helix-turn-helix domain-containing protein [Natrinema sp. DC36]|uniref:winged helix-turn-helix domain-containing protein n=1 Tax=Natrinema sp. DC36 TaxID=2878680 RepID=UPI0031F2DBB4
MNWDNVGYVISSQYRIEIMKRLDEGPKTPSAMAKPNSDIPIAHVSRALTNLREKDLVELLVPEERKKGRVYGLTDEGEAIWEEAKKQVTA